MMMEWPESCLYRQLDELLCYVKWYIEILHSQLCLCNEFACSLCPFRVSCRYSGFLPKISIIDWLASLNCQQSKVLTIFYVADHKINKFTDNVVTCPGDKTLAISKTLFSANHMFISDVMNITKLTLVFFPPGHINEKNGPTVTMETDQKLCVSITLNFIAYFMPSSCEVQELT